MTYDCLSPYQQVRYHKNMSTYILKLLKPVFQIRVRMFLGLLDPDLDPVIICMDPTPDPDPSINIQKNIEKPSFMLFSDFLMNFYL
jgi:hypothetical protein